MALDELIFSKTLKLFKRSKIKSLEKSNREVHLDILKQKLTILSRAITGKAIDIFPAEREGGYKDNVFFLPSSISLFPSREENEQYYIFRVLYLAVQQKLNLNWNEKEGTESLQRSQLKANECSSKVLHDLFLEFPITETWYKSFVASLTHDLSGKSELDTTWLYGKWMINSIKASNDVLRNQISDSALKASKDKILTTIKAKAIEEINRIEIDKKQQEDYVLTHNFEKVETAEEFDGVWRDFDGEDELKNHQEALNELSMKYTVRIDDPTHSVYQADFIENTSISESAETASSDYHLKYDEWDYAKKCYKKDFCKVYPNSITQMDVDYYANTLRKNQVTLMGMRKMLSNINNKFKQRRRQIHGDEFDLDAITDLFVDVHSNHTPSENIYISNKKSEKDLSVLLLFDVSLSADSYANGNRVIDVEKEVSILFGEILHEFNIDFSINCFFSKTRNHSTYQTLKGFDQDWNKCKYNIGAVEPSGYTRIGAALRHSGALLLPRPSKSKWLILLSDGKPNDYDKYEGRYGIYDVKQALRELNEQGIKSYALAIEAQAKYYLPQMFVHNHYQILTTPVELLKSLVRLFDKIKYQS